MSGRVNIWTDGAVSSDGDGSFFGGWGAVLRYGDFSREISGHMPSPTTNNRMELTAVVMALRAVKKPMPIQVYCDSAYVVNGFTAHLKGWKTNGWVAGRGKKAHPVANRDLWVALDAEVYRHNVYWQLVRGHADDEGNIRADELAVAAKKAGMGAHVEVELPHVPETTLALL